MQNLTGSLKNCPQAKGHEIVVSTTLTHAVCYLAESDLLDLNWFLNYVLEITVSGNKSSFQAFLLCGKINLGKGSLKTKNEEEKE